MLVTRRVKNLPRTWLPPKESRVATTPLTDRHADIDVVDAYEIQLINIRRRVRAGTTVIGHDWASPRRRWQKMMGVDEPDYGHLLADMEVFEDVAVPAGRFLYPRVEVEVGFILADDLPGTGCTEDDVLAATAAFVPSIELIDTRIRTGRSASATPSPTTRRRPAGCWEGRVSPKDIDICGIDAVLKRKRRGRRRGRSDAVLGNPVTAVAWLARKVDSFGVRLRAGDIVLPGSMHAGHRCSPG